MLSDPCQLLASMDLVVTRAALFSIKPGFSYGSYRFMLIQSNIHVFVQFLHSVHKIDVNTTQLPFLHLIKLWMQLISLGYYGTFYTKKIIVPVRMALVLHLLLILVFNLEILISIPIFYCFFCMRKSADYGMHVHENGIVHKLFMFVFVSIH